MINQYDVPMNPPVRSYRPADDVTRKAFKAIDREIIQPDENCSHDCDGRDWHVVFAEDVAAIFGEFGAEAFGFRFWYVTNGRAWYMDFAGTGGYTAPDIHSPGAFTP